MQRRQYLAACSAIGASALAGCGGGADRASTTETSLPPDTVRVDLVDYAFRPGTDETLVVDPGTTVHFVWKTGGHDIVPRDVPDDSDWTGEEEITGRGYTYDYTFTVPGKYHYVCTPHESLGMVGDIYVKDEATSSEESSSAANETAGSAANDSA
ncbi:MAG: plastocyanin/azurin family copper-binding protein [Halarchaeum sp.]